MWVVDDSPPEARRAAGVLSATYTVDIFPDASGMLERLSRGGAPPHLLVLDWRLPGSSGPETCRFLRERYDELTLPILVLTSDGEREDWQQALAAGANDYLHNPYDDAELLARTRTLVRVRQQAEALQEREERMRGLLESTAEGLWGLDAEGRCTFVNPACLRLLGYDSTEEVLGRDMHDLTHHSHADGTPYPTEACRILHVLRTGTYAEADDEVVWRKDGQPVPVRYRVSPVRRGGTVVGLVVAVEDVRAREEAEAALRASQERYRTLFESIDDGYCLLRVHFDATGHPVDCRYLETNTAFETHTGLRNAVGRRARELIPDLDASWFETYGQVALTGQSARFESDAAAMGRFYEVYASRVGPPELRQVALVFKDVTARKAAEAERKEFLVQAEAERTRLTIILSALEEGVILQDAQGTLRFSNKAAERLLGVSADQLVGRTSADPRWRPVRTDGSPYPGEEHPPMRALRSGQGIRGDVLGVHHPDGRLVWLSVNAQPFFEPDGTTPAGVVSSFLDVTAQRAADAERERLLGEVETARVRLATLVEHAPATICLLRGPDHVYELVNPPYQRLVGTNRRLLGLPVREALPEVVQQGFIGLLDTVYRTGQPFFGSEVPIRLDRRGEGTLEDAFLSQVYQPARDAAGHVVGIDAFSFDVTEQVRARREAERLMVLEQERADFEQQLIGIVSHDLRTPIAAITMGAAVLLRRPDVEERQRRTVERILSSAGRANRMIHDLLDFTQARLGGGLTAQRIPGDFHAIVRQVVEESQVSHPGRLLRLTQTGDGGGEWDADRLAQLVSNLLSNALHYSPPASEVRIETRGEPEHLVLAVHNAGAPIPPEVLPRLFQPMQRGVTEVSEARSVGLGLYIVDQVVRAHGGSVSVTSSHEDGTTFTVSLPRRAGLVSS